MENQFYHTLNKSSSEINAKGSVVADANGFCIAHNGSASPKASGVILELVKRANEIHPTSKPPVITIDYGDNVCMISQVKNYVGAVYKQSKGKH